MMPVAKYQFEAIGTKWSIDTERPLSSTDRTKIAEIVAAFDKAYSRFRDDSLVHNLAHIPAIPVEFPASIADILALYDTLHAISDGKISPLVGMSLEKLGYDATYSLQPSSPQAAPDYRLLQRSGTTLTLATPAVLDIGAVGKGYLVDRIADVVSKHHTTYVIDGSGDIAVRTTEWERVGLEHPTDPTKVIGMVHLQNASLCGSGTGKRAWGDGLHHIIDATAGTPVNTTIAATWAIAPTTVLADTLSTGLFFVEPSTLQEEFGNFYYVIAHRNGKLEHNIPAEVGELFE